MVHYDLSRGDDDDEEEDEDDDEEAMDISETLRCYVYGQCQVCSANRTNLMFKMKSVIISGIYR